MTDPASARRFQPASLAAALDEPVRRYFTHAIRDDAPLAAGIRLTMAGRIKIGRGLNGPHPARARQANS
jgi:hypothetical protein